MYPPPYYTHEEANALREAVYDDYKRDLWELFSRPLIVLIALAVIDIALGTIATRMELRRDRLLDYAEP